MSARPKPAMTSVSPPRMTATLTPGACDSAMYAFTSESTRVVNTARSCGVAVWACAVPATTNAAMIDRMDDVMDGGTRVRELAPHGTIGIPYLYARLEAA